MDFSYYPFPRVEKGGVLRGVQIDSLHDIAINKMQSIGTRSKSRDFIDLYFIVRETSYAVEQLIREARSKFDFYINPIQYGKQFLKVTELKDYPRMIKQLDQKDLESFFLNEARKLEKEILLG